MIDLSQRKVLLWFEAGAEVSSLLGRIPSGDLISVFFWKSVVRELSATNQLLNGKLVQSKIEFAQQRKDQLPPSKLSTCRLMT